MIPIERLKEIANKLDYHATLNELNIDENLVMEIAYDLLYLRQQIKEWREDSKNLAKYARHTHLCTWHNTETMECPCGYMPIINQHNALLEKYPEEE